MNLLASALPGLRDVRAPLVIGYIWVLVAWLLVQPETPLVEHYDTGTTGLVVQLADSIGALWTAAAMSVAAYLLGVVSLTVPAPFAPRRLAAIRTTDPSALEELRRLATTPWEIREGTAPSIRASARQRTVETWRRLPAQVHPPSVKGLFDDAMAAWPDMEDRQRLRVAEEVLAYTATMRTELTDRHTLLLTEDPTLFNEGDRARSEAELRLGVALPLLALSVVLAVRYSNALWLLLATGSVTLWFSGTRRRRDAEAVVVDAFRAGKVPSAAAERFVATISDERTRFGPPLSARRRRTDRPADEFADAGSGREIVASIAGDRFSKFAASRAPNGAVAGDGR
jgi:hypothetical protein